MPFFDLICDNAHEQSDRLLPAGGDKPPCFCGAPTRVLWKTRANAVIGDAIPGGVDIRHGLCEPDGTPRRYYSHSEMRLEAKRRGLVNLVEHVPLRGSDKSPHTVKWTATDTTNYDDAGVRAARQAAMAAFLGVTPERYAEITAPSRAPGISFGPTSTAQIVAQAVAAQR